MEMKKLLELVQQKKKPISNSLRLLKNDQMVADRLHHKIESMSLQKTIDYLSDIEDIMNEIESAVLSSMPKDVF
jgi:hypothetical protein